MYQKFICLFVLAALLNPAVAASTADIEPTLTVHKMEDGLIVDAVRQYAGQNQRDTTGLIPGATLLGGEMFKLRFQGCGEVKFRDGGKDRAEGIDAGRGTTPQCQIKNWDVQWKVLYSDS